MMGDRHNADGYSISSIILVLSGLGDFIDDAVVSLLADGKDGIGEE